MTKNRPGAPTLTMSEADWSRRVYEYAKLRQWHAFHALPALTKDGRWHTATQGDPGYLDWTFARQGELLVMELKTQTGRATPGQRGWLTELGEHGRLYKPNQWNDVVRDLR